MTDFATRMEAEIPGLRRYARALLRDGESADDLVHDCLERAFRRRVLWRPSGSLRSWLFTILHNIHRNHLRDSSRQPVPLPLEAARGQGEAARQLDAVALGETAAALRRLSEDQRRILLLVAVEGLRYREVAQVMDLPLGTVMSRLSRARENLRRILEQGNAKSPLKRIK